MRRLVRYMIGIGRPMTTSMPRAFISHSHKDKDRFVRKFAERLRADGVDAWFDEWEINPGDSLTEKVFSEGLPACNVMIVVLSRDSVESRWVREELNAGLVRRIEENAKLVPVRLDQCDVPTCLQHLKYQDIEDFADYDEPYQRVLDAIMGRYHKPPLGSAPKAQTMRPRLMIYTLKNLSCSRLPVFLL